MRLSGIKLLNAPFLLTPQLSDSLSRNQVTEMQKKLNALNDGEKLEYLITFVTVGVETNKNAEA